MEPAPPQKSLLPGEARKLPSAQRGLLTRPALDQATAQAVLAGGLKSVPHLPVTAVGEITPGQECRVA